MSGVPAAPTAEDMRVVGIDAGLDAVGVAPAEPFESTRRDLVERRAAGIHGGMHFTYGDPARSTDPSRALPGARALVWAPAGTGGPIPHRRPSLRRRGPVRARRPLR